MTSKTNNHIIIPTHRRVMPTIIFTDIKGVSPSPLLDVNASVDHSKPFGQNITSLIKNKP
jgi:hypothetical protein